MARTTLRSARLRPARRRTARSAALALGIGSALALSACAADVEEGGEQAGSSSASADADSPDLTVELLDAAGVDAGFVEVTETDDGTRVHVEATGLTPGFHGFHVHTIGLCEPASAALDDPEATGDFLSAGGHWNPDGSTHGQGGPGSEEEGHEAHGGDLPSLQATEDGTATLTVVTDQFDLADLEDEDGSAFMVHAGADNFANIPERYAPEGPDEDTLATGDSGDRVACGVVQGG